MNELTMFWTDLEQAMRKAVTSGLLIAAIVFMAGVQFGWSYALWIAFFIVLLVNLASRRRS